MKIKTKDYKLEKIKFYYKNKKILFLFDTYNLNSKNWLEVEQKIKNSNFNYYKVLSVLTRNFLKKTIFENFKTSINGSLKLIYLKDTKKAANLKNLQQTVFQEFELCTIKLNNKLYSKSQIKNLEVLDYKTKMYTFKENLQIFFKLNTLKLIKNSK